MNVIEQLTQSLFKKSAIEECSLHELQSLSRQYPYFAIGHLLLAEKIKTLDSSLYDHQLEKASLYFHSPLWLDYIVNKEKYSLQEITSMTQPEEPGQYIKEEDGGELKMHRETVQDPVHEEILLEIPASADETIYETDSSETPGDVIAPTLKIDSPEREENPDETLVETHIKEEDGGELKMHKETVQDPVHEEILSEIQASTDETIHETDGSETPGDVIAPTLKIDSLEREGNPDETLMETENNDDEQVQVENKSDLKISDLKIETLPDTRDDLLFEPYHTVDYFASQGIKPEQEEKPQDRFSQQLKSFTDWLKTMKRLVEPEKSQSLEAAVEQKVQSLAEYSLEDRDVVTETMAEVWIKQGDTQKATEIYNKLSLLNPSKRAYFAAKIEQLKKN